MIHFPTALLADLDSHSSSGADCADADAFDPLALATAEPPAKIAVCQFLIVVDVNEGAPYRFTGFEADAAGAALLISTVTRPLYTHGKRRVIVEGKEYWKGLADYTVDGLEEMVQIERKSLEDLYGTLGGRREDFEAEICRLNECEFAAVVVEASWRQVITEPPRHSKLNPKTVEGTINAWSMRYPRVHWFMAESRRGGERQTFKLLEMFWRQRRAKRLEGAGK